MNKINNSTKDNIIDISVTDDANNLRLDKYLKNLYSYIPYSIIQKSIRTGYIKVNSKKSSYNQLIKLDDIISIPRFILYKNNLQNNHTSTPKKISKKLLSSTENVLNESVIFKDENFIIINKPSGLAVQGGNKINISIADCLNSLKFDYPNPPHIVHRLDKGTSGILLLARTKNIAADLSDMLLNKQIKKIYKAIIYGHLKDHNLTITDPLDKSKDNYEIMTIDYGGKSAITHFKVLDANHKASLVSANLETGRKHQIRAHLSLSCKTPIIGDYKYGYQTSMFPEWNIKRPMLHSCYIEFMYNNNIINVSAELPKDFLETINDLNLSNFVLY